MESDVQRVEDQLTRAEAQKSDAYRRWEAARHQLDEASDRFGGINRRHEDLSYTIAKLQDRIEALGVLS